MAEPALGPELTVIEIDYEASTRDPGRVFRAMAALIDAFQSLDRDLARAVSVTLRAEVVLERVEAGSVRAVLRSILEQADDDALKKLDWKPLIGQYLVKGKHAMLRWLDDNDEIPSRGEILGLQRTLAELAPATNGELLPPGSVPIDRLLTDIKLISDGVEPLLPTDRATLISAVDTTPVEPQIRLSPQDIVKILTERTTRTEVPMLLLVKKPDYLGRSMWEFRGGGQAIEAKVSDERWLEDFRTGRVTLRPGAALHAIVRSEVSIGFDGAVVDSQHEVLKVLEIVEIDLDIHQQQRLLPPRADV